MVLLNAGAALFVAAAAPSIEDGIRQAAEAIDRGEARRTLDQLVSISANELVGPGADA